MTVACAQQTAGWGELDVDIATISEWLPAILTHRLRRNGGAADGWCAYPRAWTAKVEVQAWWHGEREAALALRRVGLEVA